MIDRIIELGDIRAMETHFILDALLEITHLIPTLRPDVMPMVDLTGRNYNALPAGTPLGCQAGTAFDLAADTTIEKTYGPAVLIAWDPG